MADHSRNQIYVDDFDGDTFTDLLDSLAVTLAQWMKSDDPEDETFDRETYNKMFDNLVRFFSASKFPYPNYFKGFPQAVLRD